MKRITALFISFIVISVFEIWTLQPLFSQETTLEEYSVSHGGTSETNPSGFSAKLSDKYFGNGTAKASVKFKMRDDSGTLSQKYGGRLPKEKLPLPCWYSASKSVVTIILIPSFIPRNLADLPSVTANQVIGQKS